MNDIVQKLICSWNENGTRLKEPSSLNEIVFAFESIGHSLSSDCVDFYTRVGGMEAMDTSSVTFWSIEELLRKNRKLHDSRYVWFADWLIDSHLYGLYFVDQDSPRIVSTAESSEPQVVADTFEDFLGKLIDNPESVHAWQINQESSIPK